MCCYHCSYLLTSTKACSDFCAALFCATFLEPQALRAQLTAHQHQPLTNVPLMSPSSTQTPSAARLFPGLLFLTQPLSGERHPAVASTTPLLSLRKPSQHLRSCTEGKASDCFFTFLFSLPSCTSCLFLSFATAWRS